MYAPHTQHVDVPLRTAAFTFISALRSSPFPLPSRRSGLLVANIAQSLGFLVSVGTELPYAPSRPTATTQRHPRPDLTECVCVCGVCVCVCGDRVVR